MNIKLSKKLTILSIVTLLILVSFSGFSTINAETNTERDDTHTVLVEQVTATNCYYCQFVDQALPSLVGDFERVSLGHSTYSVGAGYNDDINQRTSEVGHSGGFPKTYFDCGYQMVSGGWTGMITDLQNAYDVCAARTVADIDLTLTINWMGGAELLINLEAYNYGSTEYEGDLKVFILEIESRWNSYTGEPMVNGLLGFSFDQDVTIGAGETFTDTHTWDGDDYGYGDITSDNIKGLLVISDVTTMYVDQVVGVLPITNLAPIVDFSYTPEFPEINELVSFSDASSDSDGSIVSWDWDFGDGDTSTDQHPTHTYTEKGIYEVSLTVTDDAAATSTLEKTIIVTDVGETPFAVQLLFDRGFPIRHAADGDWAGAQNFSVTGTTLTSAQLRMRKFGNPEFDLVVELRENGPEGTLLDTLTLTAAGFPTAWTWIDLDFTDTSVTPGGDYFIVCPPAPSGVTTSFGYEWSYAFGNQYDGGSFWFTRDGGALWRDLPTSYEFAFCVYGN